MSPTDAEAMKPKQPRGGASSSLLTSQTKRNFMQTIVFDLETGPLAESELSALLPPFDPAEVKTGNLKDPAKIAEKIAEAEANHRRDFIERAALDPLTGRVVAIGVMTFDARRRNADGVRQGRKVFHHRPR